MGAATLEAIQYVLDATGSKQTMTGGAGTTTWTYHALHWLTAAAYPNGDSVSYGYDAVGSRTSLTANGTTT